MRAIATIALALLFAADALPAHGQGDLGWSDQRMIEASTLLGDRAAYPRAVALYRSVLEEFPSHLMARLWLARVLSWQGEHDASIAEYDILLAQDPPIEDLDIERAEVLSWAGRYDEAVADFDRILAERPDEQRAILGKARVYRWSGHRGDAARSYETALVLGDDATIRQELGDLRSALGAGGDAAGRHYYDSEGFSRTSVRSSATVDLDFETRFIGEMSFGRVARDPTGLLQAVGAPTATDGVSGLIGLERSLTPAVTVDAQIGYAWWESAPGQLLARGGVEASLSTGTSLALGVEHGGFLDWSDAFEAVYTGIDATSLRGTVWHGITEAWGAFGYAESTFVSDGNRRIAVGASTDYRPLRDFELLLGLGVDYLTYTSRSPLYYDPDTDVSATALIRFDQPLAEWLVLFGEGNCGLGFAEQGGLEGFGINYGVSGGLRITRGGLELTVHGGRSQSQRAIVYTSYTFGGALKVVF
jgi:hypothetical protein